MRSFCGPIYSLSATSCPRSTKSRPSQAEPFFNHCFSRMKSGSLLMFIDNNSPVFYNWFDFLAQQNKQGKRITNCLVRASVTLCERSLAVWAN